MSCPSVLDELDGSVAEDGRRGEEGKMVVRLQVAKEIVIYSAKVS
jgi:hypothetical protein